MTMLLRLASFVLLVACSFKGNNDSSHEEDQKMAMVHKLEYDTSAIAFVSFDSLKYLIGEHAIASAFITQPELAYVDSVVKVNIEHYHRFRDNNMQYPIRENYKMQLVPYVNSEAEKEVLVNAFCVATSDYRKTSPKIVFDSGSHCFKITVNLTKRKIIYPTNGEVRSCLR